MKPHLLKLTAFAALQGALFVALRAVPEPPASSPSPDAVGLVGDARLDAYLRDLLYPRWLSAPETLDRFATLEPDSHVLMGAAEAFLNGPDNYLRTLLDKTDRLKHAPGPRMIFVGGSGLAFGLDSELIAARYGYTPVNLGLHINLGPEFLLRLTEEHVRPGDVVVVCFEYDGMLFDFEAITERREEICRLSPEFGRYFAEAVRSEAGVGRSEAEADQPAAMTERLAAAKRYADDEALAEFADEVRQVAGSAAAAILRRQRADFDAEFDMRRDALLTNFRQSAAFHGRAVYQRSSFNALGDLTVHRLFQQPVDAATMQVAWSMAVPIPADIRGRIAKNVRRLNAFAAACDRRGANALFCYSPLLDHPAAAPFAREYAALVEAELEMPVLSPIERVIYPRDHFFDTPNHLNWAGTCRRMATLSAGLDRYVAPATPASIGQQIAARDRAVRGLDRVAAVPEAAKLR